MGHHHDHSESHPHSGPPSASTARAFRAGIILNLLFVVVEFAAGLSTNSLALLSDAGHNLSDVASLALSLLAFNMTKRKATQRFTYGYHKTSILASLANAVILLIAVGSIGWEAVQRFMHPEETNGSVVSAVAAAGIVINSVSAFLFYRNKDRDLNVKAAYLHLAADALVSFGVVIAGVAIYYTGIKWIDPLISLLIMAVVIYSTWGVLVESLNLSLDAVPESIDLNDVTAEMLKTEGVREVYHVHIWAMGTTRNAMTAHLKLAPGLSDEQVAALKKDLRHRVEHLGIHHSTFETEVV